MPKYTLWDKQVDIDIPKEVFPTTEEFQKREALFQCDHRWMTSHTANATLHYRVFLPAEDASKPKGVVCFAHGIQGQSGRGFVLQNGRKVAVAYVAEQLTQAGYAFYALDQYGHGFSEGPRFYVEKWQDNRADFEKFAQMVAKQHEDKPLFIMGESFGGCLSLHVAGLWEDDKSRAPKMYKGIVLMAPAIIADLPPAPVVFVLRYCLAPFFPKWSPFFMPNTVSADRIWSDPEVRGHFTQERFKEMCLEGCGRAFRLGTALQCLDAVEDIHDHIVPKLSMPFCVVHGTEDAAVLPEGTEYLLEHAKTPKEDRAVLLQEGAFHDLFSEPTADEALAFVVAFLNKWSKI